MSLLLGILTLFNTLIVDFKLLRFITEIMHMIRIQRLIVLLRLLNCINITCCKTKSFIGLENGFEIIWNKACFLIIL